MSMVEVDVYLHKEPTRKWFTRVPCLGELVTLNGSPHKVIEVLHYDGVPFSGTCAKIKVARP